ncbi:LysR family transcriptional regulator [Salinisphaera sp.]|uniref:LysR family transcriptional regulator n=1 Tax=Salinisphaera sp. TaxID=1914330 RepID=UPI002D769F5C|nr:LysR family transcriptional regulator [Salinisphaera sp.]HET7313444.1 LysR family transcriptional regulator [Salinisphaera sp.]
MSSKLNQLHFKDLQIFEILAETRSTTEAADRLALTQSAVSQALQRLEKVFDTLLMDRTTRPISMTQAGSMLKEGTSDLLATAQRLESSIQESLTINAPLIRMALVDSFTTTVGPNIVKAFKTQAEYLLILSGIAPRVNDELMQRQVDFVVTCDSLLEHRELEQRRLLREPLIAVIPKGISKRFRSLSLQQMCDTLPLIRYSIRSSMGRHVDQLLRRRQIVSASQLEFDVSESVLSMVASGIGWAITTPLCYLQARPETLGVEVLVLPDVAYDRELYLAYRKGMPDMAQRMYHLCEEHTRRFMERSLRTSMPSIFSQLSFGIDGQ